MPELHMLRSLTRSWTKEVCPYCFETYRLKETPFRCVSPPSRCKPEPDTIRAKVWDQNAPMGRVLLNTNGFLRQIRCTVCNEVSTKRLCPVCHMELPHTTGEFRSYIFAVIGAKDSGKSHFLAVLIDRIQNEIGPALSMLLQPLNDYTISRYREAFYDPVFNKHSIILGTKSAFVDRKVQLPLVYSLMFSGKSMLRRNTISKAVTLVFFDTAGEDLNDQDTMATVNKYIYRSDGIILLLDPLQLSWVRGQLGGKVPLPEQNTETSDIVTRTTNLIRAGNRLPGSSTVKTPLAVAFSKIDAVESLMDPQCQLKSRANHTGGVDGSDFRAVNDEMQALLTKWQGAYLTHQVVTQYSKHCFFGLSALGCNPHGDSRIPRVVPHRVEDPFLWLLRQHGLIREAKRA